MTDRQTAHLVGHNFRIPVPDGPEDDPEVQRAEDEAVLAHPEFQARLERARANKRAGRGIPDEELDSYFAEHPPRRSGPQPRGTTGNVRVRMPSKLHRELVEQARQQGVSLNTLIITYLSREAGYVAASAARPESAPFTR